MRKLILLILISPILSNRHKTSFDWHEPAEVKIQVLVTGDKEVQVTEKPKNDRLIEMTLRNTSLAELGQFPYYALLMMKKKGDWSPYAASIISKNWLLTTASVLVQNDRARAFAGLIDRTVIVEAEWSSGDIYNDSFAAHPFYDSRDTNKFNIGLIHLCRPVIFSINIQPARIPLTVEIKMFLYGLKGTLAGFGDMNGDGKKSLFMYYFSNPVLSSEVCAQKIGAGFDENHNICVRARHTRGGCWDDLGGALTLELVGREAIVGLYIKTDKNCESGIPTMFVNVVQYVEWIYRMTDIKETAGVRIANDKELKVAYASEIQLEMELAKQSLTSEDSNNKTNTEKSSAETTKVQEGITVSSKVEETTKPAVQKDEVQKTTTKPEVQKDEAQSTKTPVQKDEVQTAKPEVQKVTKAIQEDENQKFDDDLSDEYEEEKEDRRFQSERRIGGP